MQRQRPLGGELPEHAGGVVGAGVVDDVDRVGQTRHRGQRPQAPRQQLGAVEGDDDHRDARRTRGRAHRRNLWWPEKSPRAPASIAPRAEPEPAQVGAGHGVEPQGLGDEGEHAQHPDVVTQVDHVVAGHAVVLEVRGRVVVGRAPAHHRGAEVVGRGVGEAAGDHGPDAGPGATGAPEVLHVVAPDEELLTRGPDPLHQLAGDQDAVEGDDHVGQHHGLPRGRLDVGDAMDHPRGARQPDGEAQPLRVGVRDDRGAPEVAAPRCAAARSPGRSAEAPRRRPSATAGRDRGGRRARCRRGSPLPRRGCGPAAAPRARPSAPRPGGSGPRGSRRCWRCRPRRHAGGAHALGVHGAQHPLQQAARFQVTTTATTSGPGGLGRRQSRVDHIEGCRGDQRPALSRPGTGRRPGWPRSPRTGCPPTHRWRGPGGGGEALAGPRAGPVALGPGDGGVDHLLDLVDVGVGGHDRRGHERHRADRLGAGLEREVDEGVELARPAGRSRSAPRWPRRCRRTSRSRSAGSAG